jgi:cation diffusion facilitator family transporter
VKGLSAWLLATRPWGTLSGVHQITGVREPATAVVRGDDGSERRQANRAVGLSAVGLAATGLIELAVAVFTGSVGLLGDALHNLSDVSTSAVVFLGFRVSRRPASERYPYGLERAEDLAGLGVALVVWASAVFAGVESVHKLLGDQGTEHVGAGIAATGIGILGNQLVARYKLRVGRRIQSATLVSDAKHSWLDALSSSGALLGLIAVAAGQRWGDPVAGLAVTLFICHVGWEVSTDIGRRLLDGVEPDLIVLAEEAAMSVAGVAHAHARARWTGRTLRIEVEGWVGPDLLVREADGLGQLVGAAVHGAVPLARLVTFTSRAIPPV